MVLIENYRGWDILFNPSTESFTVESNRWDFKEDKKTFSTCKTYIDNYIKENQDFKPFFITNESNNIKKIIGIRKDKRFIYDNNGKKEQLPEYDEKNYFLANKDNDSIFEEMMNLKIKIEALLAEISNKKKSLIKVPFSTIKEQY